MTMKKSKVEVNKPELQTVMVEFSQDGNTLGTTAESESIKVFLEFQLSEKEGPFFVLETKGWSFDDFSEIQELIDKAKRILD